MEYPHPQQRKLLGSGNENEELGIGSQVEVRSEKEGFRGAWFLATVLKETEDKKKILVEYVNLSSEEKGTSLLKEYVDLKQVRPLPPVDLHHPPNFEANDLVDAYYQDGWWSGVVTQVVEPESKYQVFFPNPPDEILFSYSDLRLHRAWIQGLWLLPPQQRMRGLNFSPLAAVEVNFDPDDSRDIWFPATVVRQVSNHHFLVEYQSSRDAGFRKVGVDSFHIRPRPPISNYKSFSLLEKVDAFCDCRWFSGIVTKILADGCYIVYFKCTKEEKGLSHRDLRLHMEWADGKWVNSSWDTSPKSKSEKLSVHSDGVNTGKNPFAHEDPMAVKENNGQVIKISAGILGPCGKDSQTAESEMAERISLKHSNKRNNSNKRNKQAFPYFDAISSRYSRGSNEEALSNAALSSKTCKSNATVTAALDTSVDLDTSALDHQGKSSLKQTENMNQLSDSTNTKGDYEMHPVARKRGKAQKPQVVVEEIIEITPARSDSVKSFGQVVIGLTNDGKFSDSRAASSTQLMKAKKAIVDEEKQLSASANPSESRAASSGQLLKVKKAIIGEGKQLGASPDPENVQTEPQKEGVSTNLKRKRRRPPKVVFPLDNPKTNEAESVENKRQHVDVEGSTEEPAVDEPAAVVEPLSISSTSSPSNFRTNIVSEQFKRLHDLRRSSLGKITEKRQVRIHKMISIEAAVEPANTCVSKGKKLKSIIQAEPPTQDASDNSSRRTVEHPDNGVFRDSAVLTVTSSNASDDDRPLSAWLEGAHSPPATDRSHFVENGEIREGVEISCGQSEDKVQGERDDTSSGNNDDAKRREMPIQSSAVVASENKKLPFVKNSLIWGMIESMEVFKQIPQNPHFFPLYDCKEECREGLAIGSMVTFTSLAERIARARFDDPMNLFDGYLEALVDLEELGFNVTPVRELLHKLISIKNRHEQAQNTSKEVESQIMEQEQEKSKIGNEIAELEKKIMELKEKRAVAVSMKERKDAEIALLHLSVDAVKESQGSAQDEFDSVTASLCTC